MSAPKPAEPSEGAMFMWHRDVPEGWEFRGCDDQPWIERSGRYASGALVEARPKPPKTITVELSEDDVRYAMDDWAPDEDPWARIQIAFRKALES